MLSGVTEVGGNTSHGASAKQWIKQKTIFKALDSFTLVTLIGSMSWHVSANHIIPRQLSPAIVWKGTRCTKGKSLILLRPTKGVSLSQVRHDPRFLSILSNMIQKGKLSEKEN